MPYRATKVTVGALLADGRPAVRSRTLRAKRCTIGLTPSRRGRAAEGARATRLGTLAGSLDGGLELLREL